MKIPFSYKQHIFGSVLVASALGHLTFLAVGGFLILSPQYAVEQAPSSMEVVILKELEKKEQKVQNRRVMAMEQPSATEVRQREEKQHVVKPPKKVVIPPIKGALTETKPDYLKNPAPIYPEIARQHGWEGVVMLDVLVGSNGLVREIRPDKSSGYKVLDESALKTVRAWRFRPARVGSLSFSSRIKIPVRFLLVDEEKPTG